MPTFEVTEATTRIRRLVVVADSREAAFLAVEANPDNPEFVVTEVKLAVPTSLSIRQIGNTVPIKAV